MVFCESLPCFSHFEKPRKARNVLSNKLYACSQKTKREKTRALTNVHHAKPVTSKNTTSFAAYVETLPQSHFSNFQPRQLSYFPSTPLCSWPRGSIFISFVTPRAAKYTTKQPFSHNAIHFHLKRPKSFSPTFWRTVIYSIEPSFINFYVGRHRESIYSHTKELLGTSHAANRSENLSCQWAVRYFQSEGTRRRTDCQNSAMIDGSSDPVCAISFAALISMSLLCDQARTACIPMHFHLCPLRHPNKFYSLFALGLSVSASGFFAVFWQRPARENKLERERSPRILARPA